MEVRKRKSGENKEEEGREEEKPCDTSWRVYEEKADGS